MAIFYSYVSWPEGKEAYTALREVAMNHPHCRTYEWTRYCKSTMAMDYFFGYCTLFTSIYNKVYQLFGCSPAYPFVYLALGAEELPSPWPCRHTLSPALQLIGGSTIRLVEFVAWPAVFIHHGTHMDFAATKWCFFTNSRDFTTEYWLRVCLKIGEAAHTHSRIYIYIYVYIYIGKLLWGRSWGYKRVFWLPPMSWDRWDDGSKSGESPHLQNFGGVPSGNVKIAIENGHF